jgi:primosomal protein N' (replication factor Y)
MNKHHQGQQNSPRLILPEAVDTGLTMHEPQKFARIVIPSPLKQPLIYGIPQSLETQIAPGTRVLIPLQKRTTTGIVIKVLTENPLTAVKNIFAVLDDQPILNDELLKLADWISQYYLVSLGEVVATMLPPKSRRESKRTVVLNAEDSTVADKLARKVLQEIAQHKGKFAVKTLTRKFPGKNLERVLAQLESTGIITIEDHLAKQRLKVGKSSGSKETATDAEPLTFQLTTEQETALGAIGERVTQGGFETFLLHGVTASGKTEIYLRAIAQTRALGRRSLIIVPEISLTPQLLDRVNARFPGRVGVLHSAMTAAERWTQWWQIIGGNIDVVIGARSAVFAPISDLGLIIVDEEHDSSYKQEDGLRYNGRDPRRGARQTFALPGGLGLGNAGAGEL